MKFNRCPERVTFMVALALLVVTTGCVGDEQTRVRSNDALVRTEKDNRGSTIDMRAGAPIERHARSVAPRHIIERPSRVR